MSSNQNVKSHKDSYTNVRFYISHLAENDSVRWIGKERQLMLNKKCTDETQVKHPVHLAACYKVMNFLLFV